MRTNSPKPIGTPAAAPRSTTMMLAMDPVMVRFPASVEAIASTSQPLCGSGKLVTSVRKTNRIVSVEEGWPFAGIGSEIVMQVLETCFDDLDAPPVRVCGEDVPMPYAANLEKLALPRLDQVVAAVRKVTYR